jgi:beta-mannosidase
MARVKSVSSQRILPLNRGWECARTAPGAITEPGALYGAGLDWKPASVPGTVAAALQATGEWQLGDRLSFDAFDWWYRARVDVEEHAESRLRLHGLATLAEVFVNGERVVASDNMFQRHDIAVSLNGGSNEIAIRFLALDSALAVRRPRPRWRTRLVGKQQLRFIRSTLLGRMPGFTPGAPAVGPWGDVELCETAALRVEHVSVRSRVVGTTGVAEIDLLLEIENDQQPENASCSIGEIENDLSVVALEGNRYRLSGRVDIDDVKLWWPHTHGNPELYPVAIRVRRGTQESEIDAGKIGFRSLSIATAGDDFACNVNGVPVFCRGACWTTPDVIALRTTPERYREVLTLVRDAGMNMIRVGGTMIYEHDAFYDVCDELGILVWHDFMFANMDYPIDDEAFAASVMLEAEQFLDRVQARPCLAVLCGNSEVEQQAAMLGLAREHWRGRLFSELLPELCEKHCPGVTYCPSTPSGGALPFHTNRGVTHYYGVGAYLRPLEDARRAQVRFASECLAFANVPEDSTIERFMLEGEAPFHHPKWKASVPRDMGVGWDFEDVRDHYLELLFGVDPVLLRYSDLQRYLTLSRVVPGELMAQTFSEWRRNGSGCRGALVWFLQDLVPGAGWGVIDALDTPKAPYYYLKRSLQPVALLCVNEGLNGLSLHLVNETASSVPGTLELELYRDGDVVVAKHSSPVTLPMRSTLELSADALLGTFQDLSHAYRFGPPTFEVARARLLRDGAVLSEAFHFPVGHAFHREKLGLEATVTAETNGDVSLHVRSQRFAQAVSIEVSDYRPEDNYFHLAPGSERTVRLRRLDGGTKASNGLVNALNSSAPIRVSVAAPVST